MAKTPKLDDDYDFGFSFEEEFVPPSQSDIDEVEEKYKAKLKEVEGLILPLLYNLMKDPEKPMIKWENREPAIKQQIEKILAVTRS